MFFMGDNREVSNQFSILGVFTVVKSALSKDLAHVTGFSAGLLDSVTQIEPCAASDSAVCCV